MIRRQESACLLRKVSRLTHPISSSRRDTSSTSREPYILPRLAIDLDAHDNQYVRKATAGDYAVKPKPPRWRLWPPKEYIVTGKQRAAPSNLDKSSTLDIQKLTAPDFWAYALLGDPNASPSTYNLALRKQFKFQRVHALDNADTKIKRLIDGFTIDALKALEDAGFFSENQELIVEEIRNPSSFPRFERMLSILSSTKDGCDFLNKNGVAVVAGIMHCRERLESSKRPGQSAVLRVLNNLLISFRSKDLSFGPDLLGTGLYYASKTASGPATRTYLEVFNISEPLPSALYSLSSTKVMMAIKAMSELAIWHRHWKPQIDQAERHRERLTILTGWNSGIQIQAEERQPSFASCVIPRAKGTLAFREYLVTLGYIGARDTLRYLWNCRPQKLGMMSSEMLHGHNRISDAFLCRQYLGPFQQRRTTGGKLEVFALAFLMAEDKSAALQVLESFLIWPGQYKRLLRPRTDSPPLEYDSIHCLDTHGDSVQASDKKRPQEISSEYPEPRNPSLRLIRLGDYTQQKILWYYRINNMKPTERLQERLKAEFNLDKPETFLQRVDDLLVPDWIKAKRSANSATEDAFAQCEIDWVENEGRDGVAVVKGDETIYFKPSSRRALS